MKANETPGTFLCFLCELLCTVFWNLDPWICCFCSSLYLFGSHGVLKSYLIYRGLSIEAFVEYESLISIFLAYQVARCPIMPCVVGKCPVLCFLLTIRVEKRQNQVLYVKKYNTDSPPGFVYSVTLSWLLCGFFEQTISKPLRLSGEAVILNASM